MLWRICAALGRQNDHALTETRLVAIQKPDGGNALYKETGTMEFKTHRQPQRKASPG
jgi:hypothetical protein